MTDAEGDGSAPRPPHHDADPPAEPDAEDVAAPARPLTRGLRSAPPSSRRVSDDQRFQVSSYVPPPPKVSYREPRTITPEERAERVERDGKRRRRRTRRAVLLGAGVVILAGI